MLIDTSECAGIFVSQENANRQRVDPLLERPRRPGMPQSIERVARREFDRTTLDEFSPRFSTQLRWSLFDQMISQLLLTCKRRNEIVNFRIRHNDPLLFHRGFTDSRLDSSEGALH